MGPGNHTATIANSGTKSTAAFEIQFAYAVSAQAVFTDAAGAGSLKFEASNDATAPTNWNTVGTAATVASGATTLLPALTVCYRWIRATFVSTGGAGTIAITFQSQADIG
jgi:hypothetical protein